ncbi:putative zinc mynd-type domain containing protein [Erysiphe necator]|uniref:Putative zinc mynd-type domain containing protein n=1 Tax=Uncinula necator TaxID=52586 RepID=A0A0B1P2R1_UNCNE|nr:putative zinc mynd-type domain containing protein [Erysiphe necator]
MYPLYPDLESSLFYQSFDDCPLADEKLVPNIINLSSPTSTKYLLGTIQLEATLSTSPTYICKDSKGKLFAVTVKIPANEIKENVRGGGFDVTAWKRGWCLVIPEPKRSGVENGKQGFIALHKADVMVFPTSLERLIKISKTLHNQAMLQPEHRTCRACAAQAKPDKLKACSGCDAAWYCQKDCQIKDWNEKGHKKECKIYKSLKRLSATPYPNPT